MVRFRFSNKSKLATALAATYMAFGCQIVSIYLGTFARIHIRDIEGANSGSCTVRIGRSFLDMTGENDYRTLIKKSSLTPKTEKQIKEIGYGIFAVAGSSLVLGVLAPLIVWCRSYRRLAAILAAIAHILNYICLWSYYEVSLILSQGGNDKIEIYVTIGEAMFLIAGSSFFYLCAVLFYCDQTPYRRRNIRPYLVHHPRPREFSNPIAMDKHGVLLHEEEDENVLKYSDLDLDADGLEYGKPEKVPSPEIIRKTSVRIVRNASGIPLHEENLEQQDTLQQLERGENKSTKSSDKKSHNKKSHKRHISEAPLGEGNCVRPSMISTHMKSNTTSTREESTKPKKHSKRTYLD